MHQAFCALRIVFTLIAVLVTTVPANAEIDRYLIDTGPLRIRDQFLPGLGYLGFDPVAADILDRGEWQVDFVVTTSNTFAHSLEVERALESRPGRQPLGLEQLREIESEKPGGGLFYLDGEHTRGAFAARRGVGHGLQVEVVIPVIHLGGGFLDSTIEGFHDTFSLGQAGRLGVPRDRFTAYVRAGDREVFLDRSPGAALGDAVGFFPADPRGKARLRQEPLFPGSHREPRQLQQFGGHRPSLRRHSGVRPEMSRKRWFRNFTSGWIVGKGSVLRLDRRER